MSTSSEDRTKYIRVTEAFQLYTEKMDDQLAAERERANKEAAEANVWHDKWQVAEGEANALREALVYASSWLHSAIDSEYWHEVRQAKAHIDSALLAHEAPKDKT